MVQSTHAIADFAYDHQDHFSEWKSESNSIITLSIKDESALIKLHNKLERQGIPCSIFHEPDIDNQATSLCLFGTPEVRKQLSHLPLSLKS